MKNLNKTLGVRNSERGAIAILIAGMWATLFGLAAFAVDTGYLYTRQRGLQSIADAAVVAGMPSIQAGNRSTAVSRATSVANLNGYSGGELTVTDTATSLRVDLQRQYPTFFGRVLGMSSRTLTARAEGRTATIVTSGTPVIHTRAGCGLGLNVSGNGIFNVTGDIESNGVLRIWWPTGGLMTGTAKVQSACTSPVEPQIAGYPMPPTSPSGTPYPDPVARLPADFVGRCTFGDIGNLADPMVGAVWTCGVAAGDPDVLQAGIYCSAGGINVSSPCANQIISAVGSTFVADTGAITFGANNGITLSAHPNTLSGIVAMTLNGGNPAINLGTANAYSMSGTVYAPNGGINGGGGGTAVNTFTGAMVAREIMFGMQPGSTWNFVSSGSVSTGTWRLYQ